MPMQEIVGLMKGILSGRNACADYIFLVKREKKTRKKRKKTVLRIKIG